mmetsp:Transcript_104287/g.185377  ORF Transcript_104287/g.185377 Transcript_104287/m.185377 type:complete len:396 (-) Transcript_104287:168-1355(-)
MDVQRQLQVPPSESADEEAQISRVPTRGWRAPVLLLGATALLLVGFLVGRKSAGAATEFLGDQKEFQSLAEVNTFALEGTRCSIDVSQAVFRLMRFGNAIAKVTDEVCHGSQNVSNIEHWSEDDKKACAGAILQVIYSFTIAISMISQAVSDCAHSLNVQAQCVATVTSFMGNTEVIFGAALDAEQACRKLTVAEEIASKESTEKAIENDKILVKYNGKDRVLPAWTQVRNRAISSCVAEIGMGTTFVMRLATALTQSVTDCGPVKVDEPDGPRVCAVDLTGVLGALSFSVAFLSGGISSCQLITDGGNRKAACVSNIAGTIGGTLASLNAGMNLKAACSEEAQKNAGKSPAEVAPVLLAAQGPNMTFLDEMFNKSMEKIHEYNKNAPEELVLAD